MAYLIIKDKPKERNNSKEFNWEQFCTLIYKKTNLEFIDNSLQDLTKFLVLKNGFDETPITIKRKIFNLPKQIRRKYYKNLQYLEVTNEAIQRRKFINQEKKEIEKEIGSQIKKKIKRNKKWRNQIETDIPKGIIKISGI
jgi:hypothetical protein